jgi:hypothetical protein
MPKKNNKTEKTQLGLLMEYFKRNPNRDIPHPEIVDWATSEWKKRTGTVFRDPDRGIRRLHQDGFLIKVRKGVYHYNPKAVNKKNLEDFTAAQKEAILKRDGYKCVQCGMGKREGVELHVDHIIPKDLGGKATLENGQTLCSRCNFLKKNLKQTESGKKMFIRLYELAKSKNNKEMMDFCADILETYERYNINGHIVWKR